MTEMLVWHRPPRGPRHTKNTTATQTTVNYYAVASLLRPHTYHVANPSLRGKMLVKPKENGIRTGVVTIANHYA